MQAKLGKVQKKLAKAGAILAKLETELGKARAERGEVKTERAEFSDDVFRCAGSPWAREEWIVMNVATGDFDWLFRLQDSEPFTLARFESDTIDALAYEYAQITVFQKPGLTPHETTSTSE